MLLPEEYDSSKEDYERIKDRVGLARGRYMLPWSPTIYGHIDIEIRANVNSCYNQAQYTVLKEKNDIKNLALLERDVVNI